MKAFTQKSPQSQFESHDPFAVRRTDHKQFQIQRYGFDHNILGDFYYHLLSIPWWQFFIAFSAAYLLLNGFFASIYYFAGDNILNADPESYWDAFFFSFQTSATIGYGHMVPKSTFANVVILFDTISGLIFVAIATGLAFAKLSRPTARVLFSKNILVNTLDGKKTLMFRLGNARTSQILDAEIHAVLTRPEVSPEGISMRRIYDLKLIRNRSPLFTLSWTVMHTIDSSSPLNGLSEENIRKMALNIIISISGVDDVFSQSVYDRYIYWSDDFAFDKNFADVMGIHPKKGPFIDYHKFHDLVPCLPQSSTKPV